MKRLASGSFVDDEAFGRIMEMTFGPNWRAEVQDHKSLIDDPDEIRYWPTGKEVE